jgi:hypothetical protein
VNSVDIARRPEDAFRLLCVGRLKGVEEESQDGRHAFDPGSDRLMTQSSSERLACARSEQQSQQKRSQLTKGTTEKGALRVSCYLIQRQRPSTSRALRCRDCKLAATMAGNLVHPVGDDELGTGQEVVEVWPQRR